MNALDQPHSTRNSCFTAFCSVLVHLESFRYCMKLGEKWAELVQLIQNFEPWIRVEIFHIERTQSNHWTINPLFGAFCSVWMHLELFHYCWNFVQNDCKSLCHKVVSEFFTTNALDQPHWTLNPCFGPVHSVWVHLGSFHYYMKLCAKWAELVQLL
jgi:hypothetical protein